MKEFSHVFDEELGMFTGTPIKLHLDPTVCRIHLKAINAPFALRPKIKNELR